MFTFVTLTVKLFLQRLLTKTNGTLTGWVLEDRGIAEIHRKIGVSSLDNSFIASRCQKGRVAKN